jgi:hypothetical protein
LEASENENKIWPGIVFLVREQSIRVRTSGLVEGNEKEIKKTSDMGGCKDLNITRDRREVEAAANS